MGRFYNARFDVALAVASRATGRDESFCLDVVHDAMIRLMRGVRTSLTDEQLDLYLKRCVITAAIDRIRKDQRRRARERRPEAIPSGAHLLPNPADRLSLLREALEQIDEQDRALLIARFSRGQTIEQTGEQAGLTPGAAHGRIRRALDRLRIMLKDDEP